MAANNFLIPKSLTCLYKGQGQVFPVADPQFLIGGCSLRYTVLVKVSLLALCLFRLPWKSNILSQNPKRISEDYWQPAPSSKTDLPYPHPLASPKSQVRQAGPSVPLKEQLLSLCISIHLSAHFPLFNYDSSTARWESFLHWTRA